MPRFPRNRAEQQDMARDRMQRAIERDKAMANADPLDALARDSFRVIQLMLWKARHQNPDMYVQITREDLQGFEDCVRYLKVEPDVMITHPAGLPAQAAIPATANRRPVPAREATPPKPYVMVALVEKGTQNAIRPVENNEADFDTAREAQATRRAADRAPELAGLIIRQAQSGEFSLSDIQDAADALMTLARAVRA